MDAFSSLDFQQIRPNRLLDGGMSQLGVRQELVYRNQQRHIGMAWMDYYQFDTESQDITETKILM